MSPLAQLAAASVAVEALPNGSLRVTGPLTDPIRAMIREHKPEILVALAANDAKTDSGFIQRRERALTILAEKPEPRIAVVAVCGDPVRITVAIRDVAVAELDIPVDRYDAFALLGMLENYAGQIVHRVRDSKLPDTYLPRGTQHGDEQ